MDIFEFELIFKLDQLEVRHNLRNIKVKKHTMAAPRKLVGHDNFVRSNPHSDK